MRRRSPLLALAGGLLILLAACTDSRDLAPVVAPPTPGPSVRAEGLFEIEGNAVDDVVAGIDATTVWDRVVNGTPLPVMGEGIEVAAVAFAADSANLAGDSAFAGAGSRDHNDVPDWMWMFADDVQPEDNLLHGGAAAIIDSNTDQAFLYFFADRQDDFLDSRIGIWFFRHRVSNIGPGIIGGADPFAGMHRTGDLLLISDFGNDGSISNVSVYRWLEDADVDADAGLPDLGSEERTLNPHLDLLLLALDCGSSGPGDLACATVNDDDDTTPIPWDAGNQYEAGRYFEGGIELSGEGLGVGLSCFSTVLFETRSSQALSAELIDFVLADFSFCDASITVEADGSDEVGDPHTFDITVTPELPSGVTVRSIAIAPSLDPTDGLIVNAVDCETIPADGPYGCTVTINSSATGQFTANAGTIVTFSDGTVVTRDTDPATLTIGSGPAGSGPAVETYVDAVIEIEPGGVNEVGDTRAFTATVMIDDGGGSGFVAAPDDTRIDFGIDSGPGSLSAEVCLTVEGSCSVELTSDEVGVTMVRAGTIVTVRDVGIARSTDGSSSPSGAQNSDVALMTWVDARVEIDPGGASEVGGQHTFTATVTIDDGSGSGFVAAPDDTRIDFDIDSGPGSLSGSSCFTVEGSCSVELTSDAGGVTTVSAGTTVTVRDVRIARLTDGLGGNGAAALMTWVDARIDIDPGGAGEVGGQHTFTATVMIDDGGGSGFVAASDDTRIDFGIESGPGSLGAEVCLTVEGSCSVELTSDEIGVTTVSAGTTVMVGAVEVARSADGSSTPSGARNSDAALMTWVDARIDIDPGGAGEVGGQHTFTATVMIDDGGGSGFVAAPDDTRIDFGIESGPGSLSAAFCLTLDGSCSIGLTSNLTGITTVSASTKLTVITAAGSAALYRSTDGLGGNGAAALMTWVDAAITIESDGTKRIDDDDGFTTIFWVDDGSGTDTDGEMGTFDRQPGAIVTVTLTNGSGAVADPAGPFNGVTDRHGAYDLVFTSASTGVVTGSATGRATVAGVGLSRSTDGSTTPSGSHNSDAAVKTFVDADIAIEADVSDEVGEPHAFVVTVTADHGRGSRPVTDGHVDFTLAAADGAASVLNLGASSCDDAGANLDSSGRCTIVFASASAGRVMVQASITLDIGGVMLTFEADSSVVVAAAAVKTVVDARIEIEADGVNQVGADHTLSASVMIDAGNGAGLVPAPDGTAIDFNLENGPGTLSATNCSTSGGTGSCSVDLRSATPGTTRVSASSSVTVAGTALTPTTGAGGGGNAFVTWVDARIEIVPDAVLGAGDPPTFTVTVMENLGTGFVAAAGEMVNVTFTDADGAAAKAAEVCVTDGGGRCTVTGIGSGSGQVSVSASSMVSLGDITVVRSTDGSTTPGGARNSGPALLARVDARITIDPVTGSDETGGFHTLSATVEVDAADGSGFVPAPDGSEVTFDVMSGPGSFAGASSCTTTGGSCSVELTSDASGVTTVSATTEVVVAGVPLTRTTGTGDNNGGNAVETWVDAYITIGSDDSNGIGDAASLTVTVWEDDGSGRGFLPAAGAPVTVTLGNESGADANAAGPFIGVTDGLGAFTVTFTSATAGTVTGYASADVVVAGRSLVRETDGVVPNGEAAAKTFVAGTLSFVGVDDLGSPLCCATFEVRRTLDRFGNPIAGPIITVTDNSSADADATGGAITLDGLLLGSYEVRETAAPPDFVFDTNVKPATLSLGGPDATISEPFISHRLDDGCSPDFWQGSIGSHLWNSADDPVFEPGGGNPYSHDSLFNAIFMDMDVLDGLTMFDLVSSDGGRSDVHRAARSLVAAYLNASHDEVFYAISTIELKQMWIAAVFAFDDGGTDAAFLELHTLLDANNRLGCALE